MVLALLVALCCSTRLAAAESVAGTRHDPAPTASSDPFQLAPPKGAGPVVVRARFDLHDINAIDEGTESFEFSGVLTLTWRDPRQAFDPAVAGVNEKIFTGKQVDEIFPGWIPQLVLVNDAGLFQQSGVVLRVKPDGTSTLIQSLFTAAESEFDLRKFPFDQHRLEAVFQIMGFDKDEVRLLADEPNLPPGGVRVPQWRVMDVGMLVRELPVASAGSRGVSQAFVLHMDVQRFRFYIVRLIVLPLIIIVLLSFSVFWMDRSSLGDRVSVSFIGILTAVTYQIVMSDLLPHISYFTLIHGFLNLSFLTMSATVVVNLVVGNLDMQGKKALGNRIDFLCRWMFPLVYFGLLLAMLGAAFLLY